MLRTMEIKVPLPIKVQVDQQEVSDVQVTRALASTRASVGLEQQCTFVVLIEDIFLDGISLHLEELIQFYQLYPCFR